MGVKITENGLKIHKKTAKFHTNYSKILQNKCEKVKKAFKMTKR